MSMNGADILVYVGSDLVGSQRGATFSEANEEIDFSSKDSRAFEGAAGRYKATMSLDALYVPSDTAYLALKSAMRNGTNVTVVRNEEGADLEEASAFVTSMSEEGPDQAEATVSVDLTISGEWTTST